MEPNRAYPTSNKKDPTDNKNKPLYNVPNSERIQLIDQAFTLVLNRKASNIELSKYKYSGLTYYQLIETLLKLPEHTKKLETSNKAQKLHLQNEHLQQEIEFLKNELESKKNELDNLLSLLNIKNQTIQELRDKIKQVQEFSYPQETPKLNINSEAPGSNQPKNQKELNSLVDTILNKLNQ